jgi:hypothetical protein
MDGDVGDAPGGERRADARKARPEKVSLLSRLSGVSLSFSLVALAGFALAAAWCLDLPCFFAAQAGAGGARVAMASALASAATRAIGRERGAGLVFTAGSPGVGMAWLAVGAVGSRCVGDPAALAPRAQHINPRR